MGFHLRMQSLPDARARRRSGLEPSAIHDLTIAQI
jgi:hypothetical protein